MSSCSARNHPNQAQDNGTGREDADGLLPTEIDGLFRVAVTVVERDLGLPVERLEPDQVLASGYDEDDWFRIVATEQAHALGRERIHDDADRFGPDTLAFLQAGLAVTADAYAGARARRYQYARELDALLGDDGVLLMPTLTLRWRRMGTPHSARTEERRS